jgi:hypothetical protein
VGLLNYTTSISGEKTVSEIQAKLAQAGARQVLHEYDPLGNVSALSFRIQTQFGEIAFQLPANISAVEATLKKQARSGKIPRRFENDPAQAARVAWRILKDWVEAQLALIETGMVTVEQVFLPYAQNAIGQTVYESLLEKRFTGLALPAPQKIVEAQFGKNKIVT